MTQLDLNLLVALDVLLEEQSVGGAARRLHLSEPAMSRTLGRIRRALGDPVLVRAGRRMVPTPHALAVRAEVSAVVERARALFAPGRDVDLRTVERTFTILGHDTVAAACGAALLRRAAAEAPGVRIRFLAESHVDVPFLREGTADLEVGVVDTVAPEVHVEALHEDRMVAVVRPGHPLFAAFGGGDDDPTYGSYYGESSSYGDSSFGGSYGDSPDVTDFLFPDVDRAGSLIGPLQAWLVIVVLALIAGCVAAQRGQFARAVGAELSPERFPDAAGDPAERAEGPRFQRLKERIRLEQHAPLVMYHEKRPFCGAGVAYETWVLAVELRPDETKKEQLPLNNRAVLERIRPLLEQLRLPSEFAGHTVRDRLRWLEIDECVFLPAEGLRRREEAPYHPGAFEEHRARAVEEGAEKRRHFLRIRVGGWEEELVVTVFVRVHTQGRMLMLEIAPHVLLPVREDFKDADRAAHNYRHNNVLGKAAWAVARVPGSAARSLATLGRGVGYVWKLLTGGYAGALPDGPALSVRELGSMDEGSTFQEMDAYRYLRSVQDRVAHGVLTALAESGYQTGEFVQKIVNISSGGVHVEGGVHGSTFAAGKYATASSGTAGAGVASQKGSGSNGNG
ncbi:LysR family transcriptional regulator [Streptomyces shaanxiensis]